MIKECLNILIENNYGEMTLKPTIERLLEGFDDQQLYYLLSQNGLKISNDLTLYFYNGVGFRCFNENARIVGNKPICGVIERSLNNKYKLITS